MEEAQQQQLRAAYRVATFPWHHDICQLIAAIETLRELAPGRSFFSAELIRSLETAIENYDRYAGPPF